MGALYSLLVWFLQLVTSIFFRRIEVVGLEHVPPGGPALFVGNHPNSLLDPVLITTTCERKVHFLAKDTLFKSRFLRLFLTTLGAVPVKRRQDHGPEHAQGGLDNASAFEALFAVLRRGGFCGIFPEGISHAGSDLAPLRTGAARIAFGAAREQREQGLEPRVAVIPSGLCYHRRTRMRGRVLVQYGQPIVIDAERLAAWEADERSAVRSLTDAIEAALRAQTVSAPDFETLRVLDAVRRIYVPRGRTLSLAERAEITRRFLDHYAELADHPDVRALYQRVETYQAKLDALGLRDRDLDRLSFAWQLLRVLRHWLLVFVYAPLAVPGLMLHAPILVAAILAGDGLTPRRDVIATTKMITFTLLVPLAYAAIVAALVLGIAEPAGFWSGVSASGLLPLSGWGTIKVLERQAAFRRTLWTLGTTFVLRREVIRLQAERAALADAVREAVDRFVDPTLERIIPPDEPA